jgi:tRNA G18 (ribose-2'-O)-methylase SpoU
MHKLTPIEMHRLTAEEFREAEKIPLVVVLDNVRSLHNTGAVFRTADAFRLEAVYLCGITVHPKDEASPQWPSDLHKTALGAEDTVRHVYFKETIDAVCSLQEAGYQVFAVEQAEGSIRLSDVKLKKGQKYAVVLGHEVFGVQQAVVDKADGCIEIPQYGTKHSLNVSVTAGIVMYELSEKLRS